MSKQFRVIDAAMSESEALSVLRQHGLYAEYYRVSQGDDHKLAEALRLLSGLGCQIKCDDHDHILGSFEKVGHDGRTILAQPRVGMSRPVIGFKVKTDAPSNLLKLNFTKPRGRFYSFRGAISRNSL